MQQVVSRHDLLMQLFLVFRHTLTDLILWFHSKYYPLLSRLLLEQLDLSYLCGWLSDSVFPTQIGKLSWRRWCRRFFFFRCLLTHCCPCLIHQSIGNLMRIVAIALKWHRCGDSVRKATICGEVSDSCCSVAVTLCSFDVFSPIAAPVLYINLSGIWWGWRQYLWSGVAVATRFVRRFLVDMLVSAFALTASLFVLSIPSNQFHCMYYTSIYQEFDEDYGNAFGAA